MHSYKFTFALLLALVTVPAMAQVNTQGKNHESLTREVNKPTAVQQMSANTNGKYHTNMAPRKIQATVERLVAQQLTTQQHDQQNTLKQCVWCDRVETEEAHHTPCLADPDVQCYFGPTAPAAVSQKSISIDETRASNESDQPISSKHCMWCHRAETEKAHHTPCLADPDVQCYFGPTAPAVVSQENISIDETRASNESDQPISSKHCMWCHRAETEKAHHTPCLADPDVQCYFGPTAPAVVSQENISIDETRASNESDQPISSKHCMWCHRAETEKAHHTPCQADPDVQCYFVSQETETTQK